MSLHKYMENVVKEYEMGIIWISSLSIIEIAKLVIIAILWMWNRVYFHEHFDKHKLE